MLRLAGAAAALALIAVGAVPAGAVTRQDADACMGRDASAAVAACSRILAGDETVAVLATAYLNRCNAYLNLGNLEGAIADCSASIRHDPRAAKAYRGRGKAYLARGEHDLAIDDLTYAIRLDPAYSPAYNDRAMAYLGKGNDERSLADLDKAIELYPSAAVSYFNRALVQLRLGRTGSALTDARKAQSLRPGDPDVQKLVADIRKGGQIEVRPRLQPESQPPAAVVASEPVAQEAPPAPPPRPAVAKTEPAPAPPPEAEVKVAAKQPEAEVKVAAKQPATDPAPVALKGERRVALVIGNSDYSQVPRLPNPLRDAKTMADAFRRLGFADVRLLADLDKQEMERALLEFSDVAQGADWAVVYYAGHGMEMDGVNYLVPTDARLLQDRHVKLETVSLDDVLEAAGGANVLRLVILDACRENPFLNKMASTKATRSIGRGLARIEPTKGTLVAYAAMHGQVAEDGSGANSPFVTALLAHMGDKGLDIRLMFDKVRDSVLEATHNSQQPFTYGSLPGRTLSFNPAD